MLTPEGKDQIPTFNISMVIYQFKCYCDNSHFDLTTRQLNKRVKEHIPAFIDKFLISAKNEKENSSERIMNAV